MQFFIYIHIILKKPTRTKCLEVKIDVIRLAQH